MNIQPSSTAVHFGGGALGRGLVVPRLVEGGWSVTIVDPVAPLVDALAAANGYPLAIVDGDRVETTAIRIAGALASGRDDDAIGRVLASAPLITTAVRKENLGAVAKALAAAWANYGHPDRVMLVGCENVEHVDRHIRAALQEAGVDRPHWLTVPPTVVDRICAARWPEATEVRTEAYTEITIEAVPGDPVPPGLTGVPSIDAVFDRKRYLVNTLADASAILGLARGQRYLSEAIADQPIQDAIRPLIDLLLDHLVRLYGFRRDDLEAYLAVSRRRLSNSGIPRTLETVARDVLRKMAPGERFMAPILAGAATGVDVGEAEAVVARLVAASDAGTNASSRDTAEPFRALARGEPEAVRTTYARIAGLIATAG